MEQRDLIQDEIERIGRVLAKIMADLLDLKSTGNIADGEEIVYQSLISEFDLELEVLLKCNEQDLKELVLKRSWGPQHLDQLAEILTSTGSSIEDQTASQEYLQAAYELYKLADGNSQDFSFYRAGKMEALMKLLS